MSRPSRPSSEDTCARFSQAEVCRSDHADWQSYAAAAGATLALATGAEAAVVHTMPPSPISVQLPNQTNGNNLYGIDLDGDSQIDFNFVVEASTTMTSPGYTTVMRRGEVSAVVAGNMMLGDAGTQFTPASARRLLTSSVVSANAFNAGQIASGILRQTTFTNTTTTAPFEAGDWDSNSTGFLGVKFAVGGGDHYGWIKVATESNATGLLGLTISEWAYEDVSGGGILAGDAVGQQPDTPGDYDRNTVVEFNDYTVWKNTFGSTVVPGSGADGNGDAVVNAADYSIWRNNLPAGSGSSAGSIPEPGTCTLGVLALGAAGISALRRRH